MPYALRVVQTREYSNVGETNFRKAQQNALVLAKEQKVDVIVINHMDSAILCVASLDNHGNAMISLCTTGNTDDPHL
jgi:hypothetical protein